MFERQIPQDLHSAPLMVRRPSETGRSRSDLRYGSTTGWWLATHVLQVGPPPSEPRQCGQLINRSK